MSLRPSRDKVEVCRPDLAPLEHIFGEARAAIAASGGQVRSGAWARNEAAGGQRQGLLRQRPHQASPAPLLDLRDRERTNLGVILCSNAALLYVGLIGR